jgi:uncharacterized protein (TIGR03435 family)
MLNRPTLFVLAAALAVLPLRAQDDAGNMPPTANPSFEVSTIKPANPNYTGKNFSFKGRIFYVDNYNVEDLIALGYGYQAKQIVGEPAWFATTLYDIEGIPDTPGLPSMQQKFAMIRNLLEDRFQLKFHLAKQTMPCYILTTAKGGPRLTPSASGLNDPGNFRWMGHLGALRVRNLTFPEFVVWFQKNVTDKPLLNRTNLSGRYDFTLVWSPGESEFPQFRRTGGFTGASTETSDSAKAPPNIYKAFQEQLGLKLESTRAPVDIMVVEHAEEPSPN